MPRVDPDALEHHNLEQIFIAAKLAEAQRVEDVLTLEGIQYVVNVEKFVSGFLSLRPRNGAVFYVASAQADYCRSRLVDAGLSRGVVTEDA